MAKAIKHRGPDADGFHIHDGFGLAHRRLSIIDLSEAANQPFWSADGRYFMVYNGEVYNHRDIAKELDINLRTSSDTEVIVEAFVKWGPAMVSRLNGMFAIAIVDTLENRLFLFRDRMGIKPLYVYHHSNIFAFASELKALCVPELNLQFSLDPSSLPYYLHLGYIPQPRSIFNEVKKFPSGHWGEYDGNTFRTHCYWSLNEKIGPETLNDEHEATETLDHLLKASVKRRLMSDVPFGTFLSGGIDSSLVTAMAQECSSERIKTFSIGFNNSKFNEAHHARRVAEHLGTDHHEYIVTEEDALSLAPEMVNVFDEPFADSSAIPTMLVSKMARQSITMTLSGDGGDELFLGYGAYSWAERLNRWPVSSLHGLLASVLSLGNDRSKRVSKLFLNESSEHLPAHIFSQEQYLFLSTEMRSVLMNKDWKQLDYPLSEVKLARRLSSQERQAHFDLHYYLKDDLLTKVDRASMRFSLETRVPLLDHTAVEFALNLSQDLKRTQRTAKYLLKQVLYKRIPSELFNRPKWGFSIPLSNWLRSDLNYLITEYLSPEMVRKHGVLNAHEVSSLVSRFENHSQHHLYNRLWLLIILQQWLDSNG